MNDITSFMNVFMAILNIFFYFQIPRIISFAYWITSKFKVWLHLNSYKCIICLYKTDVLYHIYQKIYKIHLIESLSNMGKLIVMFENVILCMEWIDLKVFWKIDFIAIIEFYFKNNAQSNYLPTLSNNISQNPHLMLYPICGHIKIKVHEI